MKTVEFKAEPVVGKSFIYTFTPAFDIAREEQEGWWLTTKSIWQSYEGENRMQPFSDTELAELADKAEKFERETMDPDEKKAYGALRQGADWLLRFRTRKRQKELEQAGNVQKMTVGNTKQ